MSAALKISLKRFTVRTISRLIPEKYRKAAKRHAENNFWIRHYNAQGGAPYNRHFRYFYTEFFGFSEAAYRGRTILDVGCGPLGSLEWAEDAGLRVGLDPLADAYTKLGAHRHRMRYVKGVSEAMPFADACFDFVTSFNSLDHVDDLGRTIGELKRVTAFGGNLLIITEINHAPTLTEPQRITGDVVRAFEPEMALRGCDIFAIREDHDIYRSVMEGGSYPAGAGERPAILCARLERVC